MIKEKRTERKHSRQIIDRSHWPVVETVDTQLQIVIVTLDHMTKLMTAQITFHKEY